MAALNNGTFSSGVPQALSHMPRHQSSQPLLPSQPGPPILLDRNIFKAIYYVAIYPCNLFKSDLWTNPDKWLLDVLDANK